ncbi:MAG: hypothetical protein IDH49_13910 [Gammaproteobacteria bacterium]|nr:hypothetical protein [Gammaproteobacteria bacterium]
MPVHEYGITDFQYIAAGAAILAKPELYNAPGVVASFAGLLRNIGYAGVLPYSG